jgi:ectoine hydroxylase-related dioxygenase (phytanoyl-CoA dioxygenase family)
MKITEETIAQYDNNGATVLRGLVSEEWRQRLAAAIERDIAEPGPFYHGYESPGGGYFHGNLRIWQNDEDFRAFCLDSDLPEVARQFLRASRVNLLYDQLFVKEAGTANRTRWHNDQPYWPIRGWQVMTIWVALDQTTSESGAVEFISGSHKWDRWFQPETFGITKGIADYEINPDFEPIPDIEADRENYDIISWDLEPGDVYIFHALTVHGAPGNICKDRRRRGYAVRYIGDDVSYDPRIGVSQPILNDALQPGDPMTSDQNPQVA